MQRRGPKRKNDLSRESQADAEATWWEAVDESGNIGENFKRQQIPYH